MVMPEGDERERIRLVELDYEKTNEFIKGVVGTGAALRGSAVTLWIALLGFAFQQNVAWLAVLAALVAVVFLIVDGYHGWLYGEAAKHLRSSERMLSTYYGVLSRGEDSEEQVHEFRRDLRAYRFGLYSHLPARPKPSFLRAARPLVVYRLVYPFLVVIAVAAAVAIGFLAAGKQSQTLPQPTPGINLTVANALTNNERSELAKLSVALLHASDPEDRLFGKLIGQALAGAPAAIEAIASLGSKRVDAVEKAAAILLGALGRLDRHSSTPDTSVNIGGPQLSLGGLHVTFNGVGIPFGHCCERGERCAGGDCRPQHGGGPHLLTSLTSAPVRVP